MFEVLSSLCFARVSLHCFALWLLQNRTMCLVIVVVNSSRKEAVCGLDAQTVWRHKLDFVAMNETKSRENFKLICILFPLNVLFYLHYTINILVNFLLND